MKRPLVIVPVSGKLVVFVGVIVPDAVAADVGETPAVGDTAFASNISVGDGDGIEVGVVATVGETAVVDSGVGVAVGSTWLKAINRL